MPTTQTADLTTILLAIKADPSILEKAVALGHADETMPGLIDEINHRRKAIRARARREAKASMTRGDQVEISGLRPSSGLNGVAGEIVEVKQTRASVKIPSEGVYSKHAGKTVLIPMDCLTKI